MLSISAAYLIAGRKRSHGKLWPMGRKNQRYSFDTKMEVVIRYLDGDDPDWLAQEYGIKSEKLIHKWARKWQTCGDAGLDPHMRRSTSTNANAETELERLRRENYRLRMERDVLRALKALRESKLDSSWD
ncbi:helix-turn-helix domain-containing protein [Corynebacterium matruchotii]|uniref:helix-turn-helix domain-containing protein n=1 Tax=Corynebacterium matruchotii TaxID=43768 RepID=UPI0028EE8736|nr:helix-turn-helix domain-containing protein [Corynebacterium matruchotii]